MAVSVIAYTEKLEDGRWVMIEQAMDWHASSYSAFLAGVRNYSAIPPIAEPRGLPRDTSRAVQNEFGADGDGAAPSWLSTEELLAFDYDREFENRRVAKRMPAGYVDHGWTSEPGEGVITTYRDFLGPEYFGELDRIVRSGATRVVFWFSL